MPSKLTYGACLLLGSQAFGKIDTQLESGEYYIKLAKGRDDGKNFLSSFINCFQIKPYFFKEGMAAQIQRWKVTQVKEGYTIEAQEQKEFCPNRYLSGYERCSQRYPTMQELDDSGRAVWDLELQEDGSYTAKVAGGRDCPEMFLASGETSSSTNLVDENASSDRKLLQFIKYAPESVDLPPVVQISSLGRTDGYGELTADKDCLQKSTFIDIREDMKREHGWKAQKVPGKTNTYTFASNRNCETKYMSVGGACGQNYIEVYNRDDNSGRQHWYIEKVPGKEGAFTLTVGGRVCSKVHMTTRNGMPRTQLWGYKDKELQWFSIETFIPYTPETTDLEGNNFITSFGKEDGKIYLQQNRNCINRAELFDKKKENSSQFIFKAIPGKKSVYSIQSNSGCDSSFLSYSKSCSPQVMFWPRDDNNGLQHWFVQPVKEKPGAYTLQAFEKQENCKFVYLSTKNVWQFTILSNTKDESVQWWGIESVVPPKTIKIPQCSWIKSLGREDEKTQLMVKQKSCEPGTFLEHPGILNDGYAGDWQIKPVLGKTNTFNLVINNENCAEKFLSVSADCANNDLEFSSSDDGSGRQQWTVARVPGNENAFSIKVGGRACPRVFLSATSMARTLQLEREVEGKGEHFVFEECKAPEVSEVQVPSCARIQSPAIATSRPGTITNSYISVNQICRNGNTYMASEQEIDESRFADWNSVPVKGKVNTYNIIIAKKREVGQTGCEKKYLSIEGACDNTFIKLWHQDDGSGRQQWTISKVPGTSDKFTFKVGGRPNCDRVFLSTKKFWSRLLLWDSRYTEFQYFTIKNGDCELPDPNLVKLKTCNTVRSLREKNSKTALVTKKEDCNNNPWMVNPVDMLISEDNLENWDFYPVEGKYNTFNIVSTERNCSRKYLSVGSSCTQDFVSLWPHDDKSGRQQWKLERIEGKENTYTIEAVGKDQCENKYLSLGKKSVNPFLGKKKKSVYQQFEIETCVQAQEPVCRRIKAKKAKKGKVQLGSYTRKCSNGPSLFVPGKKYYEEDFSLVPSQKGRGYNIIARRPGCSRNYLSAADSNCGNLSVIYWSRDDGSGRQQWYISKTSNGDYTLRVRGRNQCQCNILSSIVKFGAPQLWCRKASQQTWKIEDCPPDESDSKEISDSSWWESPAFNEWNWGPDWSETEWEWQLDQGDDWRQWWKNNRSSDWRRNFDELEWNYYTQFRFWLKFVRDEDFVMPRKLKVDSKFKLTEEPGNPEVFRGGEGFAFDWIQLKGLKGFGLIKVTGKDWYLKPRKVNGRIRNGSPAVITEDLDWHCIWFWNGRRLRHYTGRWLRVTDDGNLVIQKALAGEKSIWQMIGPDESILQNFPGVPYVSEDNLLEENDPQEDDENLPLDTVEEDTAIDNEAKVNVVEDAEDDDEEEPENELEDVQTDELDFSNFKIIDDEEVDEVDPEDGEETDSTKLPLEEGQVKIVEPDEEGRIPDGNCCNPVSRKKEAVAFNKESAFSFVYSYNQITKHGNLFIYSYISESFKNYPDSMNPTKVFNLGFEVPEDNTMDPIAAFISSDFNQESQGEQLNRRVVRKILRKTVKNLESQLEIIDFAVEMMRVAQDQNLAEFAKNQKIMHENVNNFFQKALKPHRYAYNVYSRVPVSQGTVDTLSDNMIDKLKEFRVELRAMNRMGIEFRANQEMRTIAKSARRIDKEGRYQRLRTILRQSRRIMVRINREIIQKDLQDDPQFLVRYQIASNSLFRANDSRSVRCLAIWALKRRSIHPQPFETRILEGRVSERWDTEGVDTLKVVIGQLKEGEQENAVDHIGPQREQVNEYIESVFQVTREIAAVNWKQHNANQNVRPNVGAFYRNYYTSMGNWRYALKNVAL